MRRKIGIAAALLVFGVLVGLGVWQTERRAWKHALIARVEAGLAAPPRPLDATPDADAAWRRVSATGQWLVDGLVRIAPRTLDGKVGADYAAPLRLADGGAVVVLLGWAPDGGAAPDLPDGPAEVEGVLAPAPEPSLFTPDNVPPDQWLWLDPPAIAAAAGVAAARTSPLVLKLTTPPPGLAPVPARPNIVDNHLQYAFTWFGLAAAWAVVAVLLFRRRRPAQP